MVQGFWGNASWGFPKGKVNADEDPFDCAIREVKEEIGFDCTKLIKETEFIEMNIRETFTRLYVVPGVSLIEKFQPMTRGEIKSIQWVQIKNLPTCRADKDQNPNNYFVALPFIR
jgi:mRNA-decapping enzyme subunit 2